MPSLLVLSLFSTGLPTRDLAVGDPADDWDARGRRSEIQSRRCNLGDVISETLRMIGMPEGAASGGRPRANKAAADGPHEMRERVPYAHILLR
jgi:hypothetical protein